MKIAIVGAGIGGLTAGVALKKQGHGVDIFERTPSFKNVGSGIIVAANAMTVFDSLGLSDEIRKIGQPLRYACLGLKNGKILSTIDVEKASQTLSGTSVGIHRAVLHDILAQEVGLDSIHCDHELASLEQDAHAVTLTFENGQRANADMIVGADGLNSTSRELLFDDSVLRSADQTCWRGVLDRSDLEHSDAIDVDAACERLGAGARFGVVPINGGQIYWYATLSGDQIDFTLDDISAFKKKFVASWCAPVVDLLNATKDDCINVATLADRAPATRWHKGRVVLLGDAIHPTTPNLGQGACMAIESAWALAFCLKQYASLETAFAQYQELRAPRTRMITERSFKVGRLFQAPSRMVSIPRNIVLNNTPAFLQERMLGQLFRDNPVTASIA